MLVFESTTFLLSTPTSPLHSQGSYITRCHSHPLQVGFRYRRRRSGRVHDSSDDYTLSVGPAFPHRRNNHVPSIATSTPTVPMTPPTIAAVGGFDVPGPEVCICEGRGVPEDWTWEGCDDGFRNEVEVGRCGTEERSTIISRTTAYM